MDHAALGINLRLGPDDFSLPREFGAGVQRAQSDLRSHAVIELAHEGDFEITRPLRESWKKSRDFVRTALGY